MLRTLFLTGWLFANSVGVVFAQGVGSEVSRDQLIKASPDTDGDGVVNILDNCPFVSNPNQNDSIGNGVGDACRNGPPVGDIDGDWKVDCDDVAIVRSSLGSKRGDLAFDWRADVNEDGKVDQSDLHLGFSRFPSASRCKDG